MPISKKYIVDFEEDEISAFVDVPLKVDATVWSSTNGILGHPVSQLPVKCVSILKMSNPSW